MHVLHLLGALNFNPPRLTCCWYCLSPKSSTGDTKQGALLLKQVKALSGRLQTGQAGLEMVVKYLAWLASWDRGCHVHQKSLGAVLLACPAAVA